MVKLYDRENTSRDRYMEGKSDPQENINLVLKKFQESAMAVKLDMQTPGSDN